LWQSDFFSKYVVTPDGVRQCFVLAFLHVATRRVWLSPCSFKPDAPWMTVQAQSFLAHAKQQELPAEVVLRDHDGKFTAAFDGPLTAAGVAVRKVGYRSPNQNAYVERFVQAVERQCLHKFIAFGQDHLDRLCREYAQHYHAERPHQARDNRPLVEVGPGVTTGAVVCRERLGGVLRHYTRTAA
jgi:putative transposase